jgi:hypothetical protein
MEAVKFLFMQVTATLFTVIQLFVLGAAFGAGAWVVWRALERRAAIRASAPHQDGPSQPRPES